MHFDHILSTMEGRHLVFAYATVFLVQGGYAVWVGWNWMKLRRG